jgi:hypothetical protein
VIEQKAHPNPRGKKLNGLQNAIVISVLDTLTSIALAPTSKHASVIYVPI